MKVYKKNGKEVDFSLFKIKDAISKANKTTFKKYYKEIVDIYLKAEDYKTNSSEPKYETVIKITDDSFNWEQPNEGVYFPKSIGKDKFIKEISKYILVDGEFEKVLNTTQKYLKPFVNYIVKVEEISDFVEKALMKHNAFGVAKEYILYRDNKKKVSKFTDTEEKILTVIDGTNEELRGDNANKHIDVNNTARDYIAGTVCKSIAEKTLPRDVLRAHEKKWIHFHDMDYSPVMHEHNCDVYDLEDMLDNGFCMNDIQIVSPRKFSTACNLAAQTNLIISSCQYGGQTLSWVGVSKYIDKTRISSAKTLADQLLAL